MVQPLAQCPGFAPPVPLLDVVVVPELELELMPPVPVVMPPLPVLVVLALFVVELCDEEESEEDDVLVLLICPLPHAAGRAAIAADKRIPRRRHCMRAT